MTGLKIGVLTFHRCINYGSYWQARSLTEGLQQMGHRASLLDHHSPRVNIAEWKCAYRPVLPTPVPESDFPLYREKIKRFFKAFDTMPLSAPFRLEQPAEMGKWDVVVVGSDEVWNLFHPWYGDAPIFYGDGIQAERLVSYAASFGNYNASEGIDTIRASKLRKFSSISVRDNNSHQLVEQATGKAPAMVLDPCLQFEIEPDSREDAPWSEPYIAVYGHNFSPFFINAVKQVAKDRGLPLVSIGYRNEWADHQWITADPHDFAHFMEQAAAVATNFFHGCVFALRNHRPFVCETTPYRSIKLQGLMQKLGATGHLVDETTPQQRYAQLLAEPLQPHIHQEIGRLRQQSQDYLFQALA